jgi:hypothetical protein
LRPETDGRSIVVNPMIARVVPTDMLLRFREIASSSETFFTSPVLSRRKTPGLFMSRLGAASSIIIYVHVYPSEVPRLD